MLKITAEEIHFIIYQYLHESGKLTNLLVFLFWAPQLYQIAKLFIKLEKSLFGAILLSLHLTYELTHVRL